MSKQPCIPEKKKCLSSYPNQYTLSQTINYWGLIPALSVPLVTAHGAAPGVGRAATGSLAAALKLEAEAVLVASAGLAVLATTLAVLGYGLGGCRNWGRRGGRGGRLNRRRECSLVVGSGRSSGRYGGRGGLVVASRGSHRSVGRRGLRCRDIVGGDGASSGVCWYNARRRAGDVDGGNCARLVLGSRGRDVWVNGRNGARVVAFFGD